MFHRIGHMEAAQAPATADERIPLLQERPAVSVESGRVGMIYAILPDPVQPPSEVRRNLSGRMFP